MNEKKLLMKNTIIIFLGKASTQIITLLLLPLYTSYLTTDEYGLIDIILTYGYLIIPIITLQIELAVFRYIIDVRNDEEKINKIIFNNIIILMIALLLMLFAYFILRNKLIFENKLIIILILIAQMFSTNIRQIARGKGKNLEFSITSTLIGVITILSNLVFLVQFKMGAIGMLLSTLIANIIPTLYLYNKLNIKKSLNIKYLDVNLMKSMLKYSIPLIPDGISWWILNVSDRTIVTFILGVASNGVYAISNKFPNILNGIFGVFNIAWMESLSKNYNSENRDEYISSVTNDILRIFGTLGFVLISFIPVIFKFVINKNFGEAYFYIPILVLATMFNMMAAQFGTIYIANKNTNNLAISSFISAIINILVHLSFINSIKLYAAAISTLVSYIFLLVYRLLDTRKYVNIKIDINIVVILIIMYNITIIGYYMNNKYLNLLLLLSSFFVFLLLNKSLIINIAKKLILNKK